MSSDDSAAPIVVGVDGTEPNRTTIELGAREALVRRRPLRLVHAFVWPLMGLDCGPDPDDDSDELQEGGLAADADQLLAEAITYARTIGPDLTVTGEVITGTAVEVLLAEAEHAEVLVLGDRGRGGLTGLLAGSVALQVSAQSPCPVLIARGENHPAGPVVVGVDGSPTCDAAIGFAFAEATARGADLIALHTSAKPLPEGAEEQGAGEVSRLTESIARWQEHYPQVSVRQEIRRGRAAPTLVAASADAQLIVVGARGRGSLAGLLLGSVSQSVSHHARCPVAVVRRVPEKADSASG